MKKIQKEQYIAPELHFGSVRFSAFLNNSPVPGGIEGTEDETWDL